MPLLRELVIAHKYRKLRTDTNDLKFKPWVQEQQRKSLVRSMVSGISSRLIMRTVFVLLGLITLGLVVGGVVLIVHLNELQQTNRHLSRELYRQQLAHSQMPLVRLTISMPCSSPISIHSFD